MKKVLYMHTGSGNHGCEAIVRTTSSLLNGPKDINLWTLTKSEDEKYGISEIVHEIVESEQIKKFSATYFSALFKKHILHQEDAFLESFLKEQFTNSIAVSIGGDNYCYDWSAKQAIALDKKIRKYCKKSVLWGCSIDPESVDDEMKEDIAEFDLITAREKLTYNLLKEINPKTIQVADPAFLLEKRDVSLPVEFVENNTVGINVSPMIMNYGTEGKLILSNYQRVMEYILENTDMNICLIPHVVWSYSNDLKPIKILYDLFPNNNRICMIEDADCMKLKGYISQCRFFIGARTHATIAAYSSFVPTLVVGYSIKSKGIAQDLFGTDKNYVISVQSLSNENELKNQFIWLVNNEIDIKNQLKYIIPGYIECAKKAQYAMVELY